MTLFDRLPTEILLDIINSECLGAHDYVALTSVCRSTSRSAKYILYQDPIATCPSQPGTRLKQLKCLLRTIKEDGLIASYIQCIDLRHPGPCSFVWANDMGITATLGHISHRRDVPQLGECPSKPFLFPLGALFQILSRCKNLKTLKMKGHDFEGCFSCVDTLCYTQDESCASMRRRSGRRIRKSCSGAVPIHDPLYNLRDTMVQQALETLKNLSQFHLYLPKHLVCVDADRFMSTSTEEHDTQREYLLSMERNVDTSVWTLADGRPGCCPVEHRQLGYMCFICASGVFEESGMQLTPNIELTPNVDFRRRQYNFHWLVPVADKWTEGILDFYEGTTPWSPIEPPVTITRDEECWHRRYRMNHPNAF